MVTDTTISQSGTDMTSGTKVYFIGDESRCNCAGAFANILKTVDYVNIEAIFPDEKSGTIRIDANRFRSHLGRMPLPGEIGCAAAHQEAYKEILDNPSNWGLVIEDDCHILDYSILSSNIETLFEYPFSGPSIVSLYTDDKVVREVCSSTFHSPTRTLVPPPNTVAYLINQEAARILVRKNLPISYLADWPATRDEINFYLMSNTGILHGCKKTTSKIVTNSITRPRANFVTRVKIWTGYWYFENSQSWKSIYEYRNEMITPRFIYKKMQSTLFLSKKLLSSKRFLRFLIIRMLQLNPFSRRIP